MKPIVTPEIARVLAVGFAALPVGFGALRALTTGTDFRYLLTAAASLAAAALIFWFGASRVTSRWLLMCMALAVSTLIGGVVAFGLGATSVGAVWFVTFGFGVCVTASGMFGLLARSAG